MDFKRISNPKPTTLSFMRMFLYILLSLLVLLGLTSWIVLNLPSFGKNPSKNRLQAYSSPQMQEGSFANTLETAVMSPDASYWKLIRKQFSGEKREPEQSLPFQKGPWPTRDTSFHWVWFGHSTLLFQKNGLNLLLDPVFSERASPFQFMGSKRYAGTESFGLGDLPTIDYVLITHDHYDHLDYHSIIQLAKKSQIRFIVPLGVGSHLESWGITPDRIQELDWWQELDLPGELRLVMTPARHFSGRGLVRNKTLWASYSFIWSDQKVFASGDSGYGPHFKEIGEKLGPFDLAMLENGQYNEDWPLIHMMPEECWQAGRDLNATYIMPIHWGKFTLALHQWTEPVERLLRAAATADSVFLSPVAGQHNRLNHDFPRDRWWQ